MTRNLIALRAPARQRHPFRLRLFGSLPRELQSPALWRQAALFVPLALAAIGVALVGSAVLP